MENQSRIYKLAQAVINEFEQKNEMIENTY